MDCLIVYCAEESLSVCMCLGWDVCVCLQDWIEQVKNESVCS